MKKILNIVLTLSLLLGFIACDEFTPVFTGKYEEPEEGRIYTDTDFSDKTFISIEDLKAKYEENGSMPLKIEEDLVIKGQVTTSDQVGNFYRGFYIQDATAGIEIKAGLTGLYNEYKLGQWIFVSCKGLVLGDYEGAKQLGYEDYTGEYETAYIGQRSLVNKHVHKGEYGKPVEPETITYDQREDYYGKYVTIENLTYNKQIFCLVYVDPDKNHKDQTNRIFLDEDDKNAWGVTTWAMSKNKFMENLKAGKFDHAQIGNSSVLVREKRDEIGASAYSVTQYFKFPGSSKTLGVRSSGYSRFSDTEIPEEVINKSRTVTLTGVLTPYDGEPQLTFIDLKDGLKVD